MSDASYLYAIGTTWAEPFKIGVASNVPRRLERLQSGNHRQLSILWQSSPLKDAFAVEAAVHGELSARRVFGEWFLVPDASKQMLHDLAQRHGAAVRENPRRDESSVAAASACRVLLDRTGRRDRLSSEDAIGALAARLGVGRSSVWALKYRPPNDLYMSLYLAIARALWTEAGKPPFDLDNIPTPNELKKAADDLALPPTPARRALIAETEALLGQGQNRDDGAPK